MKFMNFMDQNNKSLSKQSLVELVGYRRVLVENHKGIAIYSPREIQIKVPLGRICILGSELYLTHIGREKLVVVGCVDSLQIVRRQA